MGLLPGANQENFGRVSAERPASGGLHQGIHPAGCDREMVPWGILQDKGGAG